MWVRGLKHGYQGIIIDIRQSHPMWVRGLKLTSSPIQELEPSVAPYVGAWIETLSSLSTMARSCVAPYVGAWIETTVLNFIIFRRFVAPYVGAWIETYVRMKQFGLPRSHPMWVRGLKRAFD